MKLWRRARIGELAGGGRAAIYWGVAFGLASQTLIIIAMESFRPEICDPEYGLRLHLLRARLAENPNSRLICAIGSSRVGQGLRPDQMFAATTPEQGRPVVFNLARSGAGPALELVYLRRLLDDGIRPDWLLIEIWPPYLTNVIGGWAEEDPISANRLQWRDLKSVTRFHGQFRHLQKQWFISRINPWGDQKSILLSLYGRGFLAHQDRRDAGWRTLDSWGCLAGTKFFPEADQEARKKRFGSGHEILKPALEHFEIATKPDRALRQLLESCALEGISPILLFLPESAECQSWYPPAANQKIASYMDQLALEYNVPIVDARNWIADSRFLDGYHPSWKGAAEFSVTLEQKVIQPLLAKSPLPVDVLWHSRNSNTGAEAQSKTRTHIGGHR
jgi:hypothetical protein